MSFDGIILVCLIVGILCLVSMANSLIKLNKITTTTKTVKHYVNKEKSIIPLEQEMTFNSLMVYKFLYDNRGSWHSQREIAKAINISTASVVGAVTGLINKNYAYREKVSEINMVTISEKGINHFTRSKSEH